MEEQTGMPSAPVYASESRAKYEQARAAFDPEEENVTCLRFPHMSMCACEV